MKSIAYPAIAFAIAGLLLGLTALILTRPQLAIWMQPTESQSSLPQPVTVVLEPSSPNPTPSLSRGNPDATDEIGRLESGDRNAVVAELVEPQTLATSPSQGIPVQGTTGQLRVGNRTDHPIRLALLARRSPTKTPQPSPYSDPTHWDFAPEEGSSQGLLLSLPEGNLKLKKGDILVAFAQDGSRRYWGPYVVGETSLPQWNSKATEWQLTLKR
ncbi:MAG: hypothetical protein VKJ46_08990 [Leptolyngbyaceae bacterium]|nr:hypothetical protein [Leptolyngbyaceae bacterium]